MATNFNRYYGYAIKDSGTTAQRWIFLELPVSNSVIFNSTSTTAIPASGTVLMGEVDNAKYGVYKIEVSMIASSSAAGQFEVDLQKDSQTIGKGIFSTAADTSGAFTGLLKITCITKMCCCDSVFTLLNNSAAALTPILVNNNSIQMIITKIS